VIGVEDERAQSGDGEGFADAVTFSFGDTERGLFGIARVGAAGGDGSALTVVLRDREPVGALADGGLELRGQDWEDRAAGPLRTRVLAPLERWSVASDADACSFELEFTAMSAPAEVEGAGLRGYVQLCRVSGELRAGGDTLRVNGLGERRHEWGVADWRDLELVRTVSIWLGDEHGGLTLSSLRPAGAQGHDEERVAAAMIEGGDPVPIGDPRLTTTYDGDGHQRRAGLELWMSDEDHYPRRLAGEVICGSSLDLGQLRLDLAFMRWHGEGAEGFGRYDVLRRNAG
jgi:hypothetical protein